MATDGSTPASTGRPDELTSVQAELSRALQLTARVLDNTSDGIYGLDVRGRVTFVNPAAARITGWSREEQTGRDQHALIHHSRADGSAYPVEECPVRRALRTGQTVVAPDEVFTHRSGAVVPVELTAVPVVEDGAVTGVVVSFRDLTERRAAEAQTEELRRLTLRAAQERALSDRLQQALLTPPPEPDHLEVAVRYQPAAHEAMSGATGTTPSCSPTAPPCSSSATSWGTTAGPRPRWARCAGCCAPWSTTTTSRWPTPCAGWSARRGGWR